MAKMAAIHNLVFIFSAPQGIRARTRLRSVPGQPRANASGCFGCERAVAGRLALRLCRARFAAALSRAPAIFFYPGDLRAPGEVLRAPRPPDVPAIRSRHGGQ